MAGMGVDLGVQFAPAGGVTAQSLGVPAPDCGENATPYLDSDGNWACQANPDSQAGGGGNGGLTLLLLAGLAVWILGSKTLKTGGDLLKGDFSSIL